MLIIVISYGTANDPFTCSLTATSSEVDINDVNSVRKVVCDKQHLSMDEIDEILVVENDEVVEAFNWENWS